MSLLDDDSLFEGRPTPNMNPKVYIPRKTVLRKRGSRALTCSFCDRECVELFFDIGCTYECVVSFLFYTHNHTMFDVLYVEIGKRRPYCERGVYPKILPKKPHEQSDMGYWKVNATKIYERDDIRYQSFMNNFHIYVVKDKETVIPKRLLSSCDREPIFDHTA